MKRSRLYIPVLLVGMLFFTGCLDIIETVSVNKDGTGNYKLNIDMSSLLSDPSMNGLVLSSLQGENGLFEQGQEIELDTVLYFTDMPAPEGNISADIWEKVNMKMKISESSGALKTEIVIPFNDISELEYVISTLSSYDSEVAAITEGGLLNPSTMRFALDKKKISRSNTGAINEGLNQDDLAMLQMFMTDATYTTVYEVPGKVKSTSFENAQVDDKTVTNSYNLLELMQGNANLDGSISFK